MFTWNSPIKHYILITKKYKKLNIKHTIMKKSKNWQNLLIALAAEIVICLVGVEFFNPIPLKNLANDHTLLAGCVALYICSWILCIAVLEYCTPVHPFKLAKDHHIGTLIFLIIVLILAPRWFIPLGIATAITITLLVLEWTKPSVSWGFFSCK